MSSFAREQLRKRLDVLLQGLDEADTRFAVESLIDDYCLQQFGTQVVSELKKFKSLSGGSVSCIQTYKDKAIIVSAYGFELTGSITHQGKTKLIMEELTKEDFSEKLTR